MLRLACKRSCFCSAGVNEMAVDMVIFLEKKIHQEQHFLLLKFAKTYDTLLSARAPRQTGDDMTASPETLMVADLELHVRRSAARHSVEITIERDGSLTVAAPEEATPAKLTEIVLEKREWIYRKLARKEMLLGGPPPPKEFVPGEGFFYLGSSYRLRLIDTDLQKPDAPPLVLRRGWFELARKKQGRAARHFLAWYERHGQAWIDRHTAAASSRLGVIPNSVDVRALGNRWGACTPDGRLLFHWRVVLLPARAAEYVILHELAHLHEPNHGPAFWKVMARAMPDHLARKEWLAIHGSRYDL